MVTILNWFWSTDWDTTKCVEIVYNSVHISISSLLDDDHDNENDIDREFDEARRAKLIYKL